MAMSHNSEVFKYISLMIDDLNFVSNQKLEVGWFDEDIHEIQNDTHSEPRTMSYVAEVNETGINSRPFLTPAIFKHEDEWLNTFKNSEPRKAFSILSEKVIADVRNEIDERKDSPVKEITLAVRGYREAGEIITDTFVKNLIDVFREDPDNFDYPMPSSDEPLKETMQLYDKIKGVISER